MAITKSTVSAGTSFTPNYTRVRKHATQTDAIIIEDVTGGQFNNEASGQPIWLKIITGGTIDVLSSAPGGVTAFTPDHSDWSNSRVYAKGGEVLITRYPSEPITDFSNAREATQYSLGSSDTLYLKIDHTANTLTTYE